MATVKPQNIGEKIVVNGVEITRTAGGFIIGSGLDAIFVRGEDLRIFDPVEKVRGHYPDMYPWTSPHEHPMDDEFADLALDRTYPPDGIPVDMLPRIIRQLKALVLGNVSIKANFDRDEITGEYVGTLEKGDLVAWDKDADKWVAASCPMARGIADSALFTGVAFPESDEIMSSATVTCDAWNLVPGQAYYLDCENPGKMTDVDTGYFVGLAQSTQSMYFSPYASSLEQYLTKLSESVSGNAQKLQEMTADIEEMQDTVDKLETLVQEMKDTTDGFDEKLAAATALATEAQQKVLLMENKITALEGTDALYQTYFNSIASQFQSVAATITQVVQTLTDSDETLRNNITTVGQRVEDIENRLGGGKDALTEAFNAVKARLDTLESALGDCTCEAIREALRLHKEGIDANTAAIAANTATLDSLGAQVAANTQGIADNAANISTNSRGIAALSGRVTKNEGDIAAANVLITQNDQRISDIGKQVVLNTDAIGKNTEANTRLRQDMEAALIETERRRAETEATLQGQITTNTDNITVSGEQVAKNTKGLADVATRVLALENILNDVPDGSGCTCDFTEINKAIGENAAAIAGVSLEQAKLATQQGTLTTEQAKLQADLINTKADVATNAANITNITTNITNISSDIEGLTKEQAKISTDLGTVQTTLGTVQTELTEATTKLGEIVQDIEDGTIGGTDCNCTEEIAAVQANVDALKLRVDAAEDDHAGYETRLGDVEKAIDGVTNSGTIDFSELNKSVGNNTAAISSLTRSVEANSEALNKFSSIKVISESTELTVNGGKEAALSSDINLKLDMSGFAPSVVAKENFFNVPFEQIPADKLAAFQVGEFISAPIEGLPWEEEDKSEPTLETATNIYVGGSGAGDTLIDGRGLVSELPFETLNMALYYTIGKNLASYRNFYIQGDLEENVLSSGANNSFAVNLIKGGGLQNNPKILLKKTLAFSQGFIATDGIDFEKIENGDVIDVGIRARLHFNSGKIKGNNGVVTVSNNGNAKFYNASFEMSNGGQLLYVNNFGDVALQGSITLNGECSAAGILGSRAARILLADTRLTFSGEVVGKKYMMGVYSALILNGISQDTIPGTQAGVCDASSTVVA